MDIEFQRMIAMVRNFRLLDKAGRNYLISRFEHEHAELLKPKAAGTRKRKKRGRPPGSKNK